MNHLAETVEHETRTLGRAQGALETIGGILWHRQFSNDYSQLTEQDVEGLSIALVSISDLMSRIVEHLDEALEREAKQ